MPFFIKHIPYSTYHVILVEADEGKMPMPKTVSIWDLSMENP